MNFNEFINKEVITIDNQLGIVTSIDKEHLVVKYLEIEKTYNTEIVFKNKYLKFTNLELNEKIDDFINKKVDADIKEKKLFEDNKNASITRQHKVNALYKKISMKYYFMKTLFGSDFKYPPYEEFKKKYRHQIHEPSFNFKLYRYRYWEYL